jgi:transcriptional regulator with XRE-family HTH domain
MPPRKTPTVRQKRLGAELRRLRAESGLSMDGAAAVLECGQGKISRIETGLNGVRPVELRALLDAYGVKDPTLSQALLEMAREGRKRGWWNAYGDVLPGLSDLAEVESKALSLRLWETVLVPGLLQTPDYMRTLFKRGRFNVPEGKVERHVDARLRRQLILDSATRPEMWVVLYESLLSAEFGGPRVMREQLRHVAEIAQQDKITVQVLPYTVESHRGVNGSFAIVGLPAPEADVVRIENLTASVYIEDEVQVGAYTLAFDQLRAVALAPAPSLRLIEKAAWRHES